MHAWRMLSVAAALFLLALSGWAARAQLRPLPQGNCRELAGSQTEPPVRVCRNERGEWVEQEQPIRASSVLDPAFRGSVTYRGSFQGTLATPGRTPRIDPNNPFGSAMNALSNRGAMREMAGSITFRLEFDGSSVQASYTATGSLRSGRMSGTVRNGICTIYNAVGGAPWTGPCDREGFRGSLRSLRGANPQIALTFDSSAAQVVDYVERDRQRAQQAVAARAESDRQAAAAAARVAAMPKASAALAGKLNRAVVQDSGAWAMNRYDMGSMHDVRIAAGTLSSGSYTLRGEYTYNGGSDGWVEAQLRGGVVECLTYWDVGGCSPVRSKPAQAESVDSTTNIQRNFPAYLVVRDDSTQTTYTTTCLGSDQGVCKGVNYNRSVNQVYRQESYTIVNSLSKAVLIKSSCNGDNGQELLQPKAEMSYQPNCRYLSFTPMTSQAEAAWNKKQKQENHADCEAARANLIAHHLPAYACD